MPSLAERFFERFAGLGRGHGHSIPRGTVAPSNGKHIASHETIHLPATVPLWEQHLAGTYSLGIVPIRDDATCVFGAVDIDNYNLVLDDLAKEVDEAGLPIILCRTKSGGAHLYTFTSEPVPAELMREKLMEWAVMLGHSGVEVFPKQTRLAGPNDYGNWINMPYFGGDATERYAIVNGRKLTAEKFLDLADLMAMNYQALEGFQLEAITEFQDWLADGPPCLQTLAKRGFSEGQRNNGLFNIGVYLRNRYDDDWERQLDVYNQKFMNPPLGHKEVNGVVRALSRKKYGFKCHDQPIVSVCNRQICLGRKFGIGQGEGDPGVVFGQLVKIQTKPPLWLWDVDGARIELTTQEIKDQTRFHTRVIEELNKWPQMVKPGAWQKIVKEKLEQVEVHEAPPDATQEGQMWSYLMEYCVGRPGAKKKEDLLQHKPWTHEGRTYFRAEHFRQYLEQQRMRVSEKQLWAWLRKGGAKHAFLNLKGRGVNAWHVPAFAEQTEEFDVQTIDQL